MFEIHTELARVQGNGTATLAEIDRSNAARNRVVEEFERRNQLVAQLRTAIEDQGSHPDFHQAVMRDHRAQWPTLWAAIDALLKGT